MARNGPPMKCEKCSNKATIFLTQIIDGKMVKVDLCEACAQAMGVTHSATFSLADLLLNLEKEDAGKGGAAKEPRGKTKSKEAGACPACGFTLNDLKKLGKLGCPHCYEVFESEMEEVLGEYQKNLQHRGKVPSHYARVLVKSARKQELEAALRDAVAQEKFEEAAVIRDELRRMGEHP